MKNKKNLKSLVFTISIFVLSIGGFFTYSSFNGGTNFFAGTEKLEKVITTSANDYIKDNNIGIADEFNIPLDLLKNKNYIDSSIDYSGYSSINVRKVNDTYQYSLMTSNIQEESRSNSDIPVIQIFDYRILYSISDRTNQNVLVTIISSMPVKEIDGWDRTTTYLENDTLERIFSISETINVELVAIQNSIYTKNFDVTVTNIDKTPIKVEGVSDGSIYNEDVTIKFSKQFNNQNIPLTATLNGNPIENNTVVSEEGIYTLVVIDDTLITDNEESKKVTISFTIDKQAPNVTGVENGEYYDEDVTITFDEDATATLNGNPIENNTVVSEEGSYTLIVTDEAGNKNEIKFTIDKQAPEVVDIIYTPELINGKTKVDTKVTIIYSETIELAENSSWTKVNDTTIEKTFNGNAKEETAINETIKVTDKAGKESEETNINFTIDKKAPSGTIVAEPSTPTKDPVKLIFTPDEEI
ncbi:MAG: hypothetical protein NC096_03230, partial [Candidatus Amulumruptor caecigallinarius]|nr:hypothetical protein [Candidatus Amulumruptor caecigallinarius]